MLGNKIIELFAEVSAIVLGNIDRETIVINDGDDARNGWFEASDIQCNY